MSLVDDTSTDDLKDDTAANEADQLQELGDQDNDGQQDSAPPPPKGSEIERIARAGGWKPEGEWQGDKSKWTPAEEFVAHRLESGQRAMKSLKRVEGDMARVVSAQERIMERERRAIVEDAKQRVRDAVETGDVDAALAALDEVRKPAQATSTEPPAVRDFQTRNAAWFGVNEEATAYALAMDNTLAQRAGGVPVDPDIHMRRLEAEVLKRFPELKAAAPADQQPKPEPRTPVVQRGSRTVPQRGKKTEADLPPDARTAAQQMIRMGMVKNLGEYAEVYWQENA